MTNESCYFTGQPIGGKFMNILADAAKVYQELSTFTINLANEDSEDYSDLVARVNDLQESFREVLISIAKRAPTGADMLKIYED
jgi:hypothetical protein